MFTPHTHQKYLWHSSEDQIFLMCQSFSLRIILTQKILIFQSLPNNMTHASTHTHSNRKSKYKHTWKSTKYIWHKYSAPETWPRDAHSKHPKRQAELWIDDKRILASNNNQNNTEDANSEIRKAHFLVQESTWGISQEYQNNRGIQRWLRRRGYGTKGHPSKLGIRIMGHSVLRKIIPLSRGQD